MPSSPAAVTSQTAVRPDQLVQFQVTRAQDYTEIDVSKQFDLLVVGWPTAVSLPVNVAPSARGLSFAVRLKSLHST
jgi:hypothetical protein